MKNHNHKFLGINWSIIAVGGLLVGILYQSAIYKIRIDDLYRDVDSLKIVVDKNDRILADYEHAFTFDRMWIDSESKRIDRLEECISKCDNEE
jgi:hypothetical protein